MMTVKTKTGPSTIHGTGLFADEFISKGTLVWKFSPEVDREWTKEEAEQLPEPLRSEILSLSHAFISSYSGKYISEGDDAKYANHSSDPNTIDDPHSKEEVCIAARDIARGEEITFDYRTFDEPFDERF